VHSVPDVTADGALHVWDVTLRTSVLDVSVRALFAVANSAVPAHVSSCAVSEAGVPLVSVAGSGESFVYNQDMRVESGRVCTHACAQRRSQCWLRVIDRRRALMTEHSSSSPVLPAGGNLDAQGVSLGLFRPALIRVRRCG
jgi:hypothetical protein